MTLRSLAAALTLTAAAIAAAQSADSDEALAKACDHVAALGPRSIEGVWQFGPRGRIVVIERVADESFPDVEPAQFLVTDVADGKRVGEIAATGMPSLFEFVTRTTTGNTHKFLLRKTSEAHLQMEGKHHTYRFSPLVILRHYFLTPLERSRVQPSTAGLRKLFPAGPETYSSPRYL